MSVRFTLALVLGSALAGCGSSGEVAATDEGANAQGEILGGTISDTMVPIEEVRSSSPPMKKEGSDSAGTNGGASGRDSDDDDTTQTENSTPANEPDEAEEPAEEG